MIHFDLFDRFLWILIHFEATRTRRLSFVMLCDRLIDGCVHEVTQPWAYSQGVKMSARKKRLV